ncbi:MAG: V-type ATP synthase subunit E family protein [Acidobacteriota bacterium]
MSLEKIIAKIIAEAEAEAERLIRESRDRAEVIWKEAEQEASRRSAAYLEEEERQARLQALRITSQARLEKNMALLREKRKLLDGVLEKALAEAAVGSREIRRTVILKDGVREEVVGLEELVEELRVRLEGQILEALLA